MIQLFKKQTVKQTIEEIHETFYTEVDRLLSEAKILNSLETNMQDLIDKCKRLQSLGFSNSKEVVEAKVEIKRLNGLKLENEEKKRLTEAINYFSFKYPHYKFITEKSVERICEKYGLVYGTIDRYTGTVPDVNLKHIEDFKIKQEDECYVYEIRGWGSGSLNKTYLNYQEYQNRGEARYANQQIVFMGHYTESYGRSPLEIAAPRKDFKMEGMEVKGHKLTKIEIPDPIVLKPVIYKKQKHYLIVTAWGLEASDELVVNQRNN